MSVETADLAAGQHGLCFDMSDCAQFASVIIVEGSSIECVYRHHS